MKACLVVIIALAGCLHPAVPGRFADRPIVTESDDRRPIPEPKPRRYFSRGDTAYVLVVRPIVEVFAPRRSTAARDTNAIDEVPNSTWFTNRIGMRDMSIADAVKGPARSGSPVLPLTITHAKRGGANPGFIATDLRGVDYLVKFDTVANPKQQTATNAIVARILWAAGYNTPAEFIIHVPRDQFVLSATDGLDPKTVDSMLQTATRDADGRIRATASQILEGIPKNGWSRTGLRKDDANDRVPHEHRRVLRGLRVLAAWLNHTDMKEDNSIDMYVGMPGEGHLVHYLVDFGEALGGHQDEHREPQIGFEYAWDFRSQFKAMFALGLWYRPWEAQRPSRWKSVGMFNAVNFEPRRWRERLPYAPFQLADRTDLYWGAKLVMRFDRPMLEALVKTGELGDPEAERYVVDTLLARRAAIGREFLDGVTPLDHITITGTQLCGVDLSLRYGIAKEGALLVSGTSYPIEANGKVCVTLPMSPGYHRQEVQIRRGDRVTPTLEIHYIGGPRSHLVGLVR